MSCRSHDLVPRISGDIRGLFGLCVLLVLPLFAWFGLNEIDALRLTSETWASGNWHGLWTGHWLHYTFEHFIWDVLMFSVFASLLWREERWRVGLWLFIAAPLISLFVFSVEAQLTEYRGLSALDTMLFTRFCLGFFMSEKGWGRWTFGLLPLLALVAKVCYEMTTGGALFVSDLGESVVPLPSAHFAGLAMGVLWFALTTLLNLRKYVESKTWRRSRLQ